MTDHLKIMEYNVLSTPGLVINEKLVSAGRIPSEAEIHSNRMRASSIPLAVSTCVSITKRRSALWLPSSGLGARKVATISPLPATSQPACLNDAATGLIDCGNWSVSASWAVPSNATSGIYFAKATRLDTGGATHIVFIIRDDAGTSDILFQSADTTWQAYNSYGGNSLYTGSPVGRAYKVSYNRPFNTRSVDNSQDWLFNAEYPMIRWLEANGYDVSYTTDIDADRCPNAHAGPVDRPAIGRAGGQPERQPRQHPVGSQPCPACSLSGPAGLLRVHGQPG